MRDVKGFPIGMEQISHMFHIFSIPIGKPTATAGDAPTRSASADSYCSATSAPRARRVHCCAARGMPLRCSFAVRRQHTAAYAPCSRSSRRRLPLGCARGHCFSSPQPSRAPQRYAPSSPPAASGFRALRAAQHSRPLLRLPKGGTPQGTLSAQQSADRSTRPGGRVAPASGWAASTFNSPVGPRNEPSLRFGLLAFAPSALQGHKVCSRLRPLHGFFQGFRPGRGEYSHALEPVKGTPRYARWLRHP